MRSRAALCQRTMFPRVLVGAALALGLAACSSPGDDAAEEAPPLTGTELGTKNFLQFLNRQASLAAGSYTLVAGTASAGQAGSYSLVVTLDDGTTQTFSGSWTSSGGADPASAQNPRHSLELLRPGGLNAVLTSSADGVLYLLDATGAVVAQDDNGAGGTNARIALAESKTDSLAYTNAYYATIDPLNQRDTLTKWKQVNGFDGGNDAVAVFLDTKDLGYGRYQHMKRGANGTVAFYVDNYQIQNVPGQNYSAINLDAAVSQTRSFHIGTNAIEYGPVDSDGDGVPDDIDGDGNIDGDRDDYFVRFYTFNPEPPYARRTAVDMDGLGEKGMPIPCITCHGGRADPLLPNGKFPHLGDTRGHLQAFDVDALTYSDRTGATRAELEPELKAFNCEVHKSFESSATPRPGFWNSGMAREMIAAWYGGDVCDPATTFNDTYIPAGWVHDPGTGSPPAGSDTLYREVIADNCRTCHLLRGTQDNNEIDFTSFSKFVGHAAQIEPLLYDSGRMPLAFVPYRNLFDATGAVEQIASFLPNFSRVSSNGTVLRPGRPIANAGPDRRSPSPAVVNGVASRLAQTFTWRVVSQPPGSVASLDGGNTVRPKLVATTNGVYDLELVVANSLQTSTPDRVRVIIDSAMLPAPADLRFVADIKPILQDDCVACHRPGGNGAVLPPVFYTDPLPGENRDLYNEVRARINFNDPAESPLLTKPTGRHHNGGVIAGFDLEEGGDRSRYERVREWILEGAPR